MTVSCAGRLDGVVWVVGSWMGLGIDVSSKVVRSGKGVIMVASGLQQADVISSVNEVTAIMIQRLILRPLRYW